MASGSRTRGKDEYQGNDDRRAGDGDQERSSAHGLASQQASHAWQALAFVIALA
jgi:hypothetical protein